MPDAQYEQYLRRVGAATYIDMSRRCDPARSDQPWIALRELVHQYGAPWVVQLWTKGPRGVIEKGQALIEELRKAGTVFVCQLTVTGLGPEWEPRVPWPVDWAAIDDLIKILKTPAAICWRYDPVIPGVSNSTTFETLAAQFQQRGVNRGIFNIIDLTPTDVKKRLGVLLMKVSLSEDRVALLSKLGAIGRQYGIAFGVCAESRDLASRCSLESWPCGDYKWFVAVSGRRPSKSRIPGPSRPGCLCAANYDVGQFGQYATCHGCKYCYAR